MLESGITSIISNLPAFASISGTFLVALLLTLFVIPNIIRISGEKKLLALPNSRTSHINPTPNLGGIAIFISVVVSVIIFSAGAEAGKVLSMVCSMVILLFIGLKDDILILDPKRKILGQLTAAVLIVILGDLRISDFQGVFGISEIPYWFSLVFTILFFTLIIISMNFIDGIDGLASGLSIIISLGLGIWFILTNNTIPAIISFSLIGSLIGFMRFNFFSTNAKVFMGDSGSMVTGLIVAIQCVIFLESQASASIDYRFDSAPAFTLALLFIPVFDAFRVLFLRIGERNLFKGGRNHIHHSILILTGNHKSASLILFSFTLLLIFFALIGQSLGDELLIAGMVLITSLFYISVSRSLKKKIKSQ